MRCNKQHDISDLSNTRDSIVTFYAFWNLSGPRYIEECLRVRLSLQAKNLFSEMCVSSRLPNLTIYTLPICCVLVEGNRGQTCKHTGLSCNYSGRIWTNIRLPIYDMICFNMGSYHGMFWYTLSWYLDSLTLRLRWYLKIVTKNPRTFLR